MAACWTRQRRGYSTAVCTTPSLRRYGVTTTTAVTAAIVAVFVSVAAADAVAAAAASVADYNDGSGGNSADTHHTYAYTVGKTTAAARERGAQRITTREGLGGPHYRRGTKTRPPIAAHGKRKPDTRTDSAEWL